MKNLILFLLLATYSFNANATSGRTNASGCHNSKKSGYHCHNPKVYIEPSNELTKTSKENNKTNDKKDSK